MGRMINLVLPRLGETMDEGRIGKFLVGVGQPFRRGDTLLEVESDKTTVEVPALQDGILVKWLVASDDMVAVLSPIAVIEVEGAASAEEPEPKRIAQSESMKPVSAPTPHAAMTTPSIAITRPRASTAARAHARRAGVDLAMLWGTGRAGMVTVADVQEASLPFAPTLTKSVADGTIHLRQWQPSGRPRGIAVLLHGLFSDSASFTTLGRMLAGKGFRVLAPDLPGHGQTMVPATSLGAIAQAIAAILPGGPLHFIGHSFGAMVAAHLAAEHAASLTLLSPGGVGEEINGSFLTAMLRGDVDHAEGFLGEKIPVSVAADLLIHVGANQRQLAQIIGAIADGDRQTVTIIPTLARLRMPVNAVFQRDDQVVPAAHAMNLPANVAVRFLPGASHLPHWRNPELVASLLD